MRSFTPGAQLVAIGVLHQVVGLALGRSVLAAIASDGFVSAIEPSFERIALFWFLWFGWVLLLLGGAVLALEGRGGAPRWLAIAIGVMAVGGGLMIPVSGFWLALVPVGMMVARQRTGS